MRGWRKFQQVVDRELERLPPLIDKVRVEYDAAHKAEAELSKAYRTWYASPHEKTRAVVAAQREQMIALTVLRAAVKFHLPDDVNNPALFEACKRWVRQEDE